VKEKDYSVDNEEAVLGLRCVAAPILDHQGNVVAAFSVAGPASRVTLERDAVFRWLVVLARDIASALSSSARSSIAAVSRDRAYSVPAIATALARDSSRMFAAASRRVRERSAASSPTAPSAMSSHSVAIRTKPSRRAISDPHEACAAAVPEPPGRRLVVFAAVPSPSAASLCSIIAAFPA